MPTSGPAARVESVAWRADGFEIRGHLHLPRDAYPPVVIGSHGLLADSTSPKQLALADACNRAGMAYLRFDHRGCGQSSGRLQQVTSLEGRCNDLRGALHLVRERSDLANRCAMFGSSFGGTVCLAVAAETMPIPLVTFAAPVRHQTINRPPPGGPPDDFRLTFDISAALTQVAQIHVFHGDADELVPMSNALEIFHAAADPKRITLQKDGDHRMTHPKHQKHFVRDAVKWFAHFLQNTAHTEEPPT